MGLDYTDGCVNFRDVGEFINLISGKEILPIQRLYRGGSIDFVKELSQIGHAKSIFNLRNREDFDHLDVDHYHFPMSNKIEKYNTSSKEVQQWLNQIIKGFENPDLKYPVLIHCLSGKDRTGIVVAAILMVIGIRKEDIIEEYLLSEGEVRRDLISQSISGIGNVEEYFERLDINKVISNITNAS